MKQFRHQGLVLVFVVIVTTPAAQAADGVWTNRTSGVWSDTAKWVDGAVAGGGGTATFKAASGTYEITNNMGAVLLSGLSANTDSSEGSLAAEWRIIGGTNEMVSPAMIDTRGHSLSVRAGTLSGNTDITITGLGRFFLGDDNLYTGRTIISNGNVRVARDSGLGQVPSTFQADAIILDGGGLANDDNNFILTTHANRGITVTANGGFLSAAYTSAGLQIDGPITGTGLLGINYENCGVTLNNPLNDYSGGTVVGTNGPAANPECAPTLILGQNEVLPHGSGKGGLKINTDSISNNTLPVSTLDLSGKTETVNTLLTGPLAVISSSSENQGRLIIGGLDGDSDLQGTLTGGATIEKQGGGTLSLYRGRAYVNKGTIDLAGGSLLAGGTNLGSGATVLLNGGAMVMAPASAGENVLHGRLMVATNSTLTVPPEAGRFIFAGSVTTNASVEPEPVLTVDIGGEPLLFGSAGTWPAMLDAAVASEGGIAFTNKVWLRRLPPGSYSLANGADIALDGDALLGDRSLNLTNFSVRVVSDTSVGGDGSVTANVNTVVWFDTMRYTNNRLTNSATAQAYDNNVALNSGTARFTGFGAITYSGALTGTGNAVKEGAGDLLLTGTGSSFAGEFQINAGRVLPANETALGNATVRINGGRLTNPTGGNLTLNTTPVIAQSGGIEVTAAGETMTVNGQITGVGNISKWGDGKLVVGGTGINTNVNLHVRGGTVELAKSGAATDYAILNLIGIESNTLVRLTGSNGNQIGGGVTLSGGVFDLNGISESIGVLTNTLAGGVVTNSGAQPARLAVGEGGMSSRFTGRLTDGAAALSMAKAGSGTLTIPPTAIAFTGGTQVEGGTLRISQPTPPSANLAYWLDATDASKLTLSNSYVSAWSDSSAATVNFSQPTVSNRPIYVANAINGRPAVRFGSGTRTRMFSSKNVVAKTVFIVCRMSAYSGLDGLWGQQLVDKGIRAKSLTSWQHTTNGANPDDFSYLGQMYINGVAGTSFGSLQPHILTAVCSNAVTWTTAMGDYWFSPNYARYFRGEIGEVLVYSTALSVEDRLAVESYLTAKWFGGTALTLDQTVSVAKDSRLAVDNFNLSIGALVGGGTLVPEGFSVVTLSDYMAFTGRVSGIGTVALKAEDGAAGRFLPQGFGTVVRNDGTLAAVLNVDSAGTDTFSGLVQDGTSKLGITQSGSGLVYYSGSNSTYTGETRIEAGTAMVQGGCFTRYVRFAPVLMRIGGQYYSTNQYQLSEFQLMLGGVRLPYPTGTTAYGRLGNTNLSEPPENTIDGSVDTKFYTTLSDNLGPNGLTIAMPYPVMFDAYRWYTANDGPGRDPVEWRIETSMDGLTWSVIDYQDYGDNMALVTTLRNALVGAWSVSALNEMNVFSDVSATTVASPGTLGISGTSETVGALGGDGTIRLIAGAMLKINAFTDASFVGGISGTGTVMKTGAETQALSGALAFEGLLIVDAGMLKLNGAVLAGVTNIVIRNGATLTGAATVNNPLTVTFEAGGMYSASLAVAGSLTVQGPVKLVVPEGASYPYYSTLFTYTSANQATKDALVAAVKPSPLPSGHEAVVRVTDTAAKLVIAPVGTILTLH